MTAPQRHTIVSPAGRLSADFAPAAGMICCSLRDGETELLGQRRGLEVYAQSGSTMGIPLLYPWANRLAGSSYTAAGRDVVLAPDSPLLGHDPNGLPIHGVVGGRLQWALPAGSPGGGRIAATLDWREAALLEVFPFPHRLEYEGELSDEALTITVTVHADSDGPVPVCFGFHPYLALPAGSRAHAEVSLPMRRQLTLDSQMVPTGQEQAFTPGRRPLGDSDWDAAFAGPEPPATLTAFAADAETGIEFVEGFRYSQVFAPRDSDFICLEPMTAPANALRSGSGLPVLAAGACFRACFRVRPAIRPARPRS